MKRAVIKKFTLMPLVVIALLSANSSVFALPISNGEMTNEDITRLTPVDYDWNAQWIWTSDNTTMHNWICARKTFTIDDLDEISDQVLAMISVDSRYWMWINGTRVIREGGVKRGPTENDTYMEYVDITPYLQEGENTIAVEAWFFGSEGNFYSYKSSGQGGFLLEADLGNGTVITTDDTWKVTQHTGYLISTEENNPGSQGNYRLAEGNILYDAGAAGSLLADGKEVWMESDYDDSTWENAVVYGNAGDSPWNALYERSIPQLYYSELTAFENPEVYAEYSEDYTTEPVTFQLDLPGNIQMTPVLTLEAKEAGLKIDLDTTGANNTLRASYITTEGEQEWECLGWFSTQALYVTLPTGIKVKEISYYHSGYNTTQEGSFSSDDEILNQIWQESYNTLYICMRDTFMDCPDRERAQWWGDVTSQLQEMFYTMSDSAQLLYRKGVDTVLGWISEDEEDPLYHVLQTVVPGNSEKCEVPQQELYGITGFWTYYLYTGQTDFLEEIYQPSIDYLKLWNMGEDGLVEHRKGTMEWTDWGKNQDVAIIENAWYYRALCTMQTIADILGKTDDADFLHERISLIQEHFNETFWNGEAYYYETANELPDDRAQALAVLAGLAGEEKYEAILAVFQEITNASPYMEFFVEQAMFEMGYASEALERMKAQYDTFVQDEWTTLGEFFESNVAHMKPEEVKLYFNPSHNHAWSSGPLVLLEGFGAGVYPTSSGYETWQVVPQMGTMEAIDSVVPTVIGKISVQISRTESGLDMTVDSPGNPAEIWVPVAEGQTVETEETANHLRADQIGSTTYEVYEITEAGTYTFHAK